MKSFVGTRLCVALAFFAIIFASGTIAVLGQSGRNQEKKTDASARKPKSRPRPVTEPLPESTPPVSESQGSTRTTPPIHVSDEIDPSDIIRVSSNLVPIPASVVDSKGFAITGLRLEDFELRIDGELKAIGDLTRAETAVRLVMLFDNSGSLDSAREFEKQAAMRFFQTVMRAGDEAAIYSVETESYLAQPLTKNIAVLQHTIASFGRPQGLHRSSTQSSSLAGTCGRIPGGVCW